MVSETASDWVADFEAMSAGDVHLHCRRELEAVLRQRVADIDYMLQQQKDQLARADHLIEQLAQAQARIAALESDLVKWRQAGEAWESWTELREARENVIDAAREGLVILAGLHLGITWELSPFIKSELARVAPLLRDALTALDASEKSEDATSA